MTQPDDDAAVARRIAARFGPGCWIALCVRVVPAGKQASPSGVVHTPEHFLAAAWPPLERGPARWPDAVVIGSPTPSRALAELLRHVPAEASLFLAGVDDVDGALAADVLLACDRNLEPYQRQAIEAFARAERERIRDLLPRMYTDRDPGYERFRSVVLGDRGGTG